MVCLSCVGNGAHAALGFQGMWGPYTSADLTFSAVDISSRKSNCVIASNFADTAGRNYRVTAQQDAAGDFEVTNGSGDALKIRIHYSDDSNPAEQEMSDGLELATDYSGNTTAQCASGAGVKGHLKVEVLLADYEAGSVPAGTYTGTVTVTSRVWIFTQSTTVNISIDVVNLVRITDLDNYGFDAAGWVGGNLTLINPFCVFTNSMSGTIDITATTNATYYHNGNPLRFGVLDTAPAGTLTRRYNVRIRAVGGSWVGGNYDVGETNNLTTSGANLSCSNTGENIEMRIRFSAGQITNAKGGTYLGVLELIVAPS